MGGRAGDRGRSSKGPACLLHKRWYVPIMRDTDIGKGDLLARAYDWPERSGWVPCPPLLPPVPHASRVCPTVLCCTERACRTVV